VLKKRLLCQWVSHPEHAIAKDVKLDELEETEGDLKEFTVDDAGHVIPDQLDARGHSILNSGDRCKTTQEGPCSVRSKTQPQ
jgi:hypothetical protein